MKNAKPWHLWIIGFLMLFLSSVGVYDFFMIHTGNITYIQSIKASGDVVAYFSDYPLPLSIIWGTSVGSAFLGAIFIFLKPRVAQICFGVTVTSMLILDVVTFGFRGRWETFGMSISLSDLIVFLFMIVFYMYSRSLARRFL